MAISKRRFISLAVTLALVVSIVGIAAPAVAVFLRPGIPSGNDVDPDVRSGFAGCAEGLTTFTWKGDRPGNQVTPEGLSITINSTGESLPGQDSRYVNFEVEGGEVSQVVVMTEVFIIGFITESNVYNYADPVASDTRLHPPTDRRNQPFKIDGFRFCYEPTLDISGRVYEDLNADGDDENGVDPALAGEDWAITVSDSGGVIGTAIPAEDGSYSFDDLASGSYTVCQDSPDGWIQSTPPDEGCYNVNSSTSDADFGKYRVATISGSVLIDADGDGDLTDDTTGLEGSTVTANGNSAVSDSDGSYTINGITPGTYDVCQEPPTGWTQSVPPSDGCHEGVVVESGDALTGFVFGNFQPGSISGARLINGDGFPGQPVRLLDGDGEEVDTTMTGNDGSFEFIGLTPGDYTVCTGNVDPGTTPSGPASEACGEGEVGTDVTVASGVAVMDVDFTDTVEGAETATCGADPSQLEGEGVSGELFLEGCEGTKVIRFLADPDPDEEINEVSFDNVGQWTGGGYALEHWTFANVPTSTAGDWRLYYNDNDVDDVVAPFCLADPRNSETTVPDDLDPNDYLPTGHTTCIIEDNRTVVGSEVQGEFWLFSIGDPARGFR